MPRRLCPRCAPRRMVCTQLRRCCPSSSPLGSPRRCHRQDRSCQLHTTGSAPRPRSHTCPARSERRTSCPLREPCPSDIPRRLSALPSLSTSPLDNSGMLCWPGRSPCPLGTPCRCQSQRSPRCLLGSPRTPDGHRGFAARPGTLCSWTPQPPTTGSRGTERTARRRRRSTCQPGSSYIRPSPVEQRTCQTHTACTLWQSRRTCPRRTPRTHPVSCWFGSARSDSSGTECCPRAPGTARTCPLSSLCTPTGRPMWPCGQQRMPSIRRLQLRRCFQRGMQCSQCGHR